MNGNLLISLIRSAARGGAAGVAVTLLLCQLGRAQTITNPSFEANSFSVAPGYISDNSPIPGWRADNDAGAGLNPAGGSSQFANNGVIPDGNNVAFITGGTTLSTTITGLTAGTVYKVTFQANAPTGTAPILRASVDGQELLAVAVYPAGGTGPYGYLAFEFTAAGATAELGLFSDAAMDVALLVDNFTVAVSSGKWTVEAWNDDSDSGINSQYVYTHAYNFGTANGVTINGVPFTGVAGANPAVPGKFSTTFMGNVFNNDANNVFGDSSGLATDFVYSGANVSAGSYQSITLEGLAPGSEYVVTIYTVGFDSPGPTIRWATFSVGEDRLTVNQDQFGNDMGSRISYRYTAGADGTAMIRFAPVNPVNVSIHVYGFSNRAVSQNVPPSITLQPQSTVVSQGVPVSFVVDAIGAPAPTLQWRFNGVNISGATAKTFSIAQPSPQDAGSYDVIAANSLGSATSVVARLSVGLPMTNPSFEADSFLSWPGYSGDNVGNANTPPGPNIPITGWTQSATNGSGINPVSDGSAPFADNGTIPNGAQVAFIQADSTLGQTVSGLTPGSQYYVHYYENSRSASGTLPPGALELKVGATTVVPAHVVLAVGSGNPYHAVSSDVFIAESATVGITFTKSNPRGGDSTVLVDNVAILPVAPGTAPVIVRQPEPQSVAVGSSATFNAGFVGSLPADVQWLKNGNPVSGATSATLTLANVQKNDEGDYALRVTNSSGTVTSAAARLTVTVPGVFGTGVDADGKLLPPGAVDPHYTLTLSADPDFPGPDAIVVNDGWPIQSGVWVLNGPDSKWIAPQAAQGTGNAEGDYIYSTTFDLTGFDVSKVSLVGAWAVDNTGTDIVVNGTSTGITSGGFASMTPFTITNGLVAGKNTLEFKVNNAPATPNPTALRVDLKAVVATEVPTETKLQVSRSGSEITISWTEPPAGQKLESAINILGPWTEVQNASNPFKTTASGTQTFYRTRR